MKTRISSAMTLLVLYGLIASPLPACSGTASTSELEGSSTMRTEDPPPDMTPGANASSMREAPEAPMADPVVTPATPEEPEDVTGADGDDMASNEQTGSGRPLDPSEGRAEPNEPQPPPADPAAGSADDSTVPPVEPPGDDDDSVLPAEPPTDSNGDASSGSGDPEPPVNDGATPSPDDSTDSNGEDPPSGTVGSDQDDDDAPIVDVLPEEPAVDQRETNLAGTWAGVTSQGLPIELVIVEGGALASFSYEVALPLCSMEVETTLGAAIPIVDNHVERTQPGQPAAVLAVDFLSSETATGTLAVSSSPPVIPGVPMCRGAVQLTFELARQ